MTGALTQRETADVLGLGSGAAVRLQLRRLAKELPADRDLRRHVDRIVALRSAKEKVRQELANARKELRKILTVRQEAVLVLSDLLD